MNTESRNELYQDLHRIFGDEAAAVIQAQAEIQEAEQVLLNAGISPNEVYEQAVVDIRLSEKLTEHGIVPPRRLDRLSDAEFSALDGQQLEAYLTAYGIDVPAMVEEAESAVYGRRQRPWSGWPESWGIPADAWLRTASAVLPQNWAVPSGIRPYRTAVAATAVFCLVAVASGVALTLFRTQPVTGNLNAQVDMNNPEAEPASTLNTVDSTGPGNPVASPPETIMLAALTRTDLDVNAGIGGWLPSEVLNESAVMVNSQPAGSESRSIVPQLGITEQLVQLVQEPVNQVKVTEFVFSSGDTLSHGLKAGGLPMQNWQKIVRLVGSQFQPGDELIFYSQNNEHEQLLVFRKGKTPIIVTADMRLQAATATRKEIQTVRGRVETSLYAALVRDLDESVVWRIGTLLEHGKVPLKSLPRGAAYEIRIERIVGEDNETIRYGEIRNVRIDTGSQGTFEYSA